MKIHCYSVTTLVCCRLEVLPPCPQTISYTSCDINHLDLQSFHRAIYTSRLYDDELFESEFTLVLDVDAPLRTKTRRQGKHDRVPLSDEARTAKRTCRRFKRRFRRSGSSKRRGTLHGNCYTAHQHAHRAIVHTSGFWFDSFYVRVSTITAI